VGRKRDKWTNAWEVERLTQLRADVDSALGRFLTECVRQSTHVAPELADEWLRRAGLVEELRDWALKDIDRWITEKCEEDGRDC
jgi:hypothetical protein